jgi:hypothetical protein
MPALGFRVAATRGCWCLARPARPNGHAAAGRVGGLGLSVEKLSCSRHVGEFGATRPRQHAGASRVVKPHKPVRRTRYGQEPAKGARSDTLPEHRVEASATLHEHWVEASATLHDHSA